MHVSLLPYPHCVWIAYSAHSKFMGSRVYYACLGVTYRLHFWQNDFGLLCATVVMFGMEWILKNQHRKFALEKKILPLLLPGFKLKPLGRESGALLTELSQPPTQSTEIPVIEAVQQNLVLINQRKCPRYQCVLALSPFLTGAKWNGRIKKKKCLVFVYVLHKFMLGLVLWGFGNLWFDDVCRVVRDRLKFVFSPDVILCGWLSSKY